MKAKNSFKTDGGAVEGSLADKKTWQAATRHLKRVDPVLRGVIETHGAYEFELEDGYYESLVGAIIFQQLAGKAA